MSNETRLSRIRQILDAAAGDSAASYGGLGRFWHQPPDTLATLDLLGERLIAPAPSCCGCAPGERSAQSALIKGLRGEPPFDGSRFPPLPWGGTPVAPEDIRFIADWIDDGCRDDDHVADLPLGTLEADGARPETRVLGDIAEFQVFTGGVNGYDFRQGEQRQGAAIDCLSEPQSEAYRQAFPTILDLQAHELDRRNYNNQALIHQNHCQHGWERFLPWHRAYVYEFEQNLQDFHPDVMMPYWDWTAPQYRPDHPEKGWVIPQACQAFLRVRKAERMIAKLKPRPTAEQRRAIMALAEKRVLFKNQRAFFTEIVCNIGYTHVTPDPADANRAAMIRALYRSNPLWYPLRYPAQYRDGGTINSVIHYHYPTAQDIRQILSLNNFRDFGGGNLYNDSFGFLDQNPHNTMHIWTGGQNPDAGKTEYACKDPVGATATPPEQETGYGPSGTRVRGRIFHSEVDLASQPAVGDMFSNLTASYDPIFWPVHVNVDRLWADWQVRNPHGLPADLDSVLSPWSYTIRDMLDIGRFGYEYVQGSYLLPVGLEAPITRFVSAPIKVPAAMRDFKRAELRLHRVPQLVRSCFVRAFLNQPGADASTPVTGNPHYAGYLAIFGHAECYGGPGHCDLPPPRARDHDLRARSHNTPRNHRIDVTECARRMLEAGDELRISLLVIGVDHREETDLMRLEGVSLNFLN